MNIVTIATEGKWVDVHLKRWVRYAKGSLYLILAGKCDAGLRKVFSGIRDYDLGVANRVWFNEARMEAVELFGLKDILYVDCDCDILGELDEKELRGEGVGWVKSPTVHRNWVEVCQKKGYDYPEKMANNGFLWLDRSYKDDWEKAKESVEGLGLGERTLGTSVFNEMLRSVKNRELSQENSVIWSDARNVLTAKAIQYCNDFGQAKRERLEKLWDIKQRVGAII
jgi:hypothetical protein